MKKFEFRLQPVLDLRKRQEDQKKRAVGVLQAQINEQQRQALEMAATIEEQGRLLKDQYAQGQVNLDWVAHYRRFVTHTQQAINQRIRKVAEIQQQMLIARKELAEAAKQRKILEKLKEKKQRDYGRKLDRAETLQQDEIAANMFLQSKHSA